jgi:hypothetical protein
MFKVRTVEPKKQPLLANGPVTTIVSRQWFGKHVPAAMDTHATKRYSWKRCFLVPCKRAIRKRWGNRANSVRVTVKKRGSWKRVEREPPFREDLSAEAEESPLRETVPRERLVKTQQAGKS